MGQEIELPDLTAKTKAKKLLLEKIDEIRCIANTSYSEDKLFIINSIRDLNNSLLTDFRAINTDRSNGNEEQKYRVQGIYQILTELIVNHDLRKSLINYYTVLYLLINECRLLKKDLHELSDYLVKVLQESLKSNLSDDQNLSLSVISEKTKEQEDLESSIEDSYLEGLYQKVINEMPESQLSNLKPQEAEKFQSYFTNDLDFSKESIKESGIDKPLEESLNITQPLKFTRLERSQSCFDLGRDFNFENSVNLPTEAQKDSLPNIHKSSEGSEKSAHMPSKSGQKIFIDWENIEALVKELGGTLTNEHEAKQNQSAKFTKGSEQYTLSQNNENGVITLSAQNSSFKQFAKTLTALVAAKIQSQPGEGVTVTFKHVGNATKEEYLSALEELKALGEKCNVTINKDPSCDNELFNEALRAIEKSNEKPMPFKEKIESKPAENDPVQET
ncbi:MULTISPECIES: hypothetical protein [Cysteiniphilum]|uniref:Uncharacterized protein n=1 Tax=Cysteiniphilum litorale TaxID=2056700 RepID=A0A8J2Z393_9GAMM|nr:MULTISPECIES: hypothetical protein [Cysteiniphilum]GGF93425.1 hypothetical protein GCM10010995_08230 [Cysteiniphilum litorale]